MVMCVNNFCVDGFLGTLKGNIMKSGVDDNFCRQLSLLSPTSRKVGIREFFFDIVFVFLIFYCI